MENIGLFVLTVGVYFVTWYLIRRFGSKASKPIALSFKGYVKIVALIELLCLPININGYVFTVIGNAVGEKGVYSLSSLYQKADSGDTWTFLGLSGYQKAGGDAVTFLGLSGYQKAGKDAVTVFGLSGYQKAGKDAVTLLGLSGYQKAGGDTLNFAGLTGYQKAGEDAVTFLGLSGYQKAGNFALIGVGIACYQSVAGKTRVFGSFSKLKKD